VALKLNIQITGLTEAKPNLRYTIFDSVASEEDPLVIIGSGTVDLPLSGLIELPIEGKAFGDTVGVNFSEFDGVSLENAKGAQVWVQVSGEADTPTVVPAVVIGQSVTLPAQTQIVNIVALGASILSYIFSGRSTLIKNMFADKGLTVNIYDESQGGRHVNEVLAHWETVKTNYTAMGDTCVCIGHVIGNDGTGYHPYSSMSAAQRTALIQDVQDLTDSVTGNGNIFMPIEASFRGYDNDTLGEYYTWENEDNGILPFNTFIMNPASQNATPAQYDTINSKSFLQWYNFTYNYGVDYLETIPNRIHPTGDGIEFYRRFLVDNIAAYIKGEPNIVHEKQVWTDAIVSKRIPQAFWVTSTYNVPTGAGFTYPYSNSLDASDTSMAEGAFMLPIVGYQPNSIKLGKGPIVMTYGTSSNIATDTSLASFPSTYTGRYMYCVNSTMEEFITMTGFYPNQDVEITIIAASGGGNYNVSTFQFNDDVDNTLAIIARLSDTSWGTRTVPADENGQIVISMKGYTSSGGATRGYFNAMKVVPL
jgi:hypothetical protein